MTVLGAAARGAQTGRWTRYAIAAMIAAIAPMLLGAIGIVDDAWALRFGLGISVAVAAIGLNILMGYAGQLSLGHFAILGLGAFVSSKLTAPTAETPQALPFLVGVLGAIAAGAFIAFLIGLPALRLRGLYLAIVTVAFSYVAEQSLFRSDFLSRGSAGVSLPPPQIGDLKVTGTGYVAMLAVIAVLVWLLDDNLTRSRFGRAFHAIRADEGMAASFGIDVARTKLLAFTLSGAFAGLAGAMYGHNYGVVSSESFKLDRSLLLVIIVVLGGLGSRAGAVVAALFYAVFFAFLVDQFGNGFLGWDLILGAALLLYTLAQHPTGLAGAWRAAVRARRGGSAHGDPEAAPIPARMPRPADLKLDVATVERRAPLLVATDVTVDFGGLRAVDHATIAVPRGKIIGLIGPNGAGKTTLFNAIAGAVTPTSGQVILDGKDLSRAPAHVRARAGLGRTFQLIGLAKDQSVTENLLLAQHQNARYGLASALSGIGPSVKREAELRARAADALDGLGFERYRDAPVGELSHGQQRIVEIACALLTAPMLVMLDEPSAGMAPGAVENLALRLRDIRDELGRTVLLIEHNVPLVLDVCDELYVLAEGRVIAHGEPSEVVQEPEVMTAYLGRIPEPGAVAT